MIVCPNCSHPNPEGAVQCESCYTPLPATIACPNCQAEIQADASFCGQCGFNLKPVSAPMLSTPESSIPDPQELPPLVVPDSLIEPEPIVLPTQATPASIPQANSRTQIQQIYARLLNLQTSTEIEIPPGLPVIHIGKPNDRIPPDIDVSGFPNAEVVSRIHADIRIEGDAYYIEDVGSSNGTYINNSPLPMGNRHRLRAGDRISLGKGDKVSFLFQI